MQSSSSQSSQTQLSSVNNSQSINLGFVLGPDDIEVLKTYLKEFQDGDRTTQADVIGKALGEVYRRRPGNPQFDKKEATEVCMIYLHV